MKKIALFLAIICLCATVFAQNKLTATSAQGTNVDTILQRHLAGEGVKISNGRANGSTGNINTSKIGTFVKNNATFPFHAGIYMITGGDYNDATNTFTQKNLSNIVSNIGSGRGSALDFEFIAYADTFSFNYVFASEEYTSYTCSQYNDIFAFFLEGYDPLTISFTTKNVALIPGTLTVSNPIGIPVTINSVNNHCSGSNSCSNSGVAQPCYNGTYSNYFTYGYNNSYPSSLGSFNGSTVKLSACAPILACQTYKMHLAITNVSDNSLDSGVFLEEGSFYSPSLEIGNVYENDFSGGDTLIQNCRACDLTFSLPVPPSSGNISVDVAVGGNATLAQDFRLLLPNSVDLSPTNNSFVFNPGQLQESLHMEILPTAQFAPNEVKTVKVYFKTERCPDDQESWTFDTLTFYLRGNDSVKINRSNLTFGACDTLKSIELELLRGNPVNYKWLPATGINNTNTLSPQTSITQSTTYKVIAADQWNCMTDTVDVTVNIVPKPDFSLTYSPNHGCVPLPVTLMTQYTPNYATLKWTVSDADGNTYQDTLSQSFVTLADTGYYDVKLYVESAPGCADSAIHKNAIHVSDYPVAEFTFSPEEPGNGEVIYFYNASTGDNITNYSWNFGDGHSSFVEEPTHSYHLKESDIKTVVLTVTNADGCSDNVVHPVSVEDNFAVFVPNGFTPNVDGNNEVFLPKVNDVTNYKLEIYARNGEMIFFTNNPEQGWDGTIKNSPAPEGVYVYQIYYSRIGTPNEVMKKVGSLTLIR